MIDVPEKFKKPIGVIYPPNNFECYEEWLPKNYIGCDTDRLFLPINWTAYYVNNNYGNDKEALSELQEYINSLDKKTKYWTCIQYDDGILNNVGDLDVLEFNMSKTGVNMVGMPLLCQPHPYKFTGSKKYFASFVGSRTHPVRDELEQLKEKGYLISFERMDIESYCRILHESMFGLCPRGYGMNSFRVAECLQYGAIPVIIADDLIFPSYKDDFSPYGVFVDSRDVSNIDKILGNIDVSEVIKMQNRLQAVYNMHYTYESNLKRIITILGAEYNTRQKG